jgi:hypothetical protein
MPPLQGKTKTYSNLVLVGPKSVNNRVYAPDVLRRAVEDGLYDGVPIFLDHEEKIQTLVGRVTKAYWDEDKNCVRGDIEIYDSPYSSIIDIIINVFGGEFGFSHVVEAEVDEDKESGKEYVKHISKVKSVDLVTDPATTKGINEVQERVMNAIRSVIKESRKKQLKECGENMTQKPAVNMQSLGVVDSLIQSYYNGEISLPALVKLLEILSQGELREKLERKEGKTMPKRKLKEQESDFMKDEKMDEKDKEVVDSEETKEQEEDKEKEDETLEEGEDLENVEDGEDSEDKEVEEEEMSEEDDESDEEELEEQDEEEMEDEGDGDVEEEMDEEVEEDHEEDENKHEDKELKESKKRSKNKTKQVKESVLSLKRELNLTRKKLRESQKLLEEIVKSRYVPSLKEYKIISESKDPVGLIKILSEKRVVVTKSKPKTISESRNSTQQPDEWDQMIEEVRRRKGLIR